MAGSLPSCFGSSMLQALPDLSLVRLCGWWVDKLVSLPKHVWPKRNTSCLMRVDPAWWATPTHDRQSLHRKGTSVNGLLEENEEAGLSHVVTLHGRKSALGAWDRKELFHPKPGLGNHGQSFPCSIASQVSREEWLAIYWQQEFNSPERLL